MSTFAVIPGALGTETIREVALIVLKNIKIDRNGDGKIDGGEVSTALLAFAPAIFNAKDLVAEVKDYTKRELYADLDWLATQLPAVAPFRTEVTALIVAIIKLVEAAVVAVAAGVDLKKKTSEMEAFATAEPLSPEDQKKRPGAGELKKADNPVGTADQFN
jgi:hypothetical protein